MLMAITNSAITSTSPVHTSSLKNFSTEKVLFNTSKMSINVAKKMRTREFN